MESHTTHPRLAHLSADGQRTQTVQDHLEGTARLGDGQGFLGAGTGGRPAPYGAQNDLLLL